MNFQFKPQLSKRKIRKFKTSQTGNKYLTQCKKSLEYRLIAEIGVVIVTLCLFYV